METEHVGHVCEDGDTQPAYYKARIWISRYRLFTLSSSRSVAWLPVNKASFDLCWPIWIHRNEQGSPMGIV